MASQSRPRFERPIVHASYARGPVRGGERQLLLLAGQLAEMGVPQAVLCRRGDGLHDAVLEMPGVQVIAVRHHLIDGLRPCPASVYHAHEARASYWAAIASLISGTPYVITRRVPNPLSGNVLTRKVYRNASALVGISTAVCESVKRDTGRDATLIYSTHRDLSPDPDEVRRIRGEIGGGPVIGQVGALVDSHKGQSVSIAAFERIRAEHPGAKLVFLGAGADEAELRGKAQGPGNIVFAGHRENIADWMAAFDLLLHPAYEEGLGSSLLDAMHLGIPIVASRVGGIPEIAVDGDSALLVEAGNPETLAEAALSLIGNRELRERIVAGGHRVADRHGAHAMARAYLGLYESILGKSR